jgi:citrate lyase subunit beta/citryl-CoA lyase
MMKSTHPLADAQAFLFVPADRPERFEKALNTKAHAIIIDLEDAVAMTHKASARETLKQVLPALLHTQRARIVVRINAYESTQFAEDIAMLKDLPIAAVMLPKAESSEQLTTVQAVLSQDSVILPMVESAQGIDQLKSMASHPATLRLALGNIDVQAALGVTCDREETELLPLRYTMSLVSKLCHIAAPIDGVTVDIKAPQQLLDDTQRAKRIGFTGKLCIHPSQIDPVIQMFLPTQEEIKKAQLIVQADKNSLGGVVQLDGRMIDRPVVLLAQRILKLASQS